MKPPYTEEEVDSVLATKGITIPSGFYRYLTRISREIPSGYAHTISLSEFPNKSTTQCTLNDQVSGDSIIWDYFIFDKILDNIEDYKANKFDMSKIDSIEYHYDDEDWDTNFYSEKYLKEDKENKLDDNIKAIIRYTYTYYEKMKKNFVTLEDHGCDSTVCIYLGDGIYKGSIWDRDEAVSIVSLKYSSFDGYPSSITHSYSRAI